MAPDLVMRNPANLAIAMPAGLPRALATHCAEEYANLAAILPDLYRRFGG